MSRRLFLKADCRAGRHWYRHPSRPRIGNAAVSHPLDVRHVLHAEVVTLRVSDNPWDRVEFAILLQTGADGALNST